MFETFRSASYRALGRAVGAAFLCAGLAACGQETIIVTDVYDHPISTKSLRMYVHRTGGFGLVVVNGPASPDAPRQIAATLKVPGHNDMPVTPILDRADVYRIVLIFDPAGGGAFNEHHVCSGAIGAVATNRIPDTMRIYGTVCAADRPVSRATTFSVAFEPTDPRFRQVADTLMLALFPAIPRGDRADCAFC